MQDVDDMEREKELWGRKFKIVDNGLDEAEVYSFVDSLTNQYGNFTKRFEQIDNLVTRLAEQYGNLVQKLDHFDQSPEKDLMHSHTADADLSRSTHPDSLTTPTNGNSPEFDVDKLENIDSLTRFAERTVIEAAKQAKIMKAEIEEKAIAKANSIIAHAEEKARIEADKIMADAELRARERGDEIVAVLQQEAHRQTNTVHSDIRRIMADAERSAEEKVQEILSNVKEKIEESAQIIQQDTEQILSKKISDVKKEDLKSVLGNINQKFIYLSELLESPSNLSTAEDATLVNNVNIEASGHVPIETTIKETQETDDLGPAETTENYTDLFEGTIELALPPPVALDQMLQLHKHLKEAPHVEVLNLGGSVEKGITIRILMDNPTPILNIIGDLPEVETVLEEHPDADKTVPGRESKEDPPIRRIIITTKH